MYQGGVGRCSTDELSVLQGLLTAARRDLFLLDFSMGQELTGYVSGFRGRDFARPASVSYRSTGSATRKAALLGSQFANRARASGLHHTHGRPVATSGQLRLRLSYQQSQALLAGLVLAELQE